MILSCSCTGLGLDFRILQPLLQHFPSYVTASASRFQNRKPNGIVMFDLDYQIRPPRLVLDLPAFMHGGLSLRTEIKRKML